MCNWIGAPDTHGVLPQVAATQSPTKTSIMTTKLLPVAVLALATSAVAQAPAFLYRSVDSLKIDRTYRTRAVCTDSVGGQPVETVDEIFQVPAAVLATVPLTGQGGTASASWVQLDRPTVNIMHASQPTDCDQGTMRADANRHGTARIKASALRIQMTTVEESVDEVEVLGLGCAADGPLTPLVSGTAKTQSTNTVNSTTPFGLRAPATLQVDSLFTYYNSSCFGPASGLAGRVHARLEVFRDVNANGVFEAGIDVSVLQVAGTPLSVGMQGPHAPQTDLRGPVQVNLGAGRYLAILTFDHDFSVTTAGNFMITRPWTVSAGDDARASASLSLVALPVVAPAPAPTGTVVGN